MILNEQVFFHPLETLKDSNIKQKIISKFLHFMALDLYLANIYSQN
jgi:hypothetical protein